MSKQPAKSVHDGHRARTRQEFLARGLQGMSDHRVLELLLYNAIPRGDVNPLAHRLIDRFGSLPGVFHATYEQLLAVEGVGPNTACLLQLVIPVAARYLEDLVSVEGRLVNSWQFRDLLLSLFLGERVETAYLICMDNKNRVLACRKLSEGTVDAVQISTRKVLETALACGASKVALAHNHVAGLAFWSEEDVTATLRLKQLLLNVGITLLDHFILAGDDMISMADSGLLRGRRL